MKRVRYFLLIIAGVLAGVVLLFLGKPNFTAQSETIILNIDGRNYNLLTARTMAEKTRGLSGIREPAELGGADGMIFYFSGAQFTSFWNKNTHLDLDLVWMRDGKVVGRDFLPAEDKAGLVIKKSPAEIDWVVELVKK